AALARGGAPRAARRENPAAPRGGRLGGPDHRVASPPPPAGDPKLRVTTDVTLIGPPGPNPRHLVPLGPTDTRRRLHLLAVFCGSERQEPSRAASRSLATPR